MKFYFKSGLFIFCLISGLCLISCDGDTEKVQANSRTEGTIEKVKERPKEEEIQYFHVVGRYYLSIKPLHSHHNLRKLSDVDIEDYGMSYQDWTDEDLESYIRIDNFLGDAGFGSYYHYINLQGEPIDIRNLVDQSDFVRLPDNEGADIFFKIKKDLRNYGMIDEYYAIKKGFSSLKYYCKEPIPSALPEELILHDRLLVKLYDKNHRIISENKIRDRTPPDNINDFKPYQMKVSDFKGVGETQVIGTLELPLKGEREGLKYRLVRLKPDGQPSLYFDTDVETPHQNYIREELLPPYSEYKNWEYYEEIGCYAYSNRLRDQVHNRRK